MITSNEIQLAYIDLYKCLRNYIWDFETVESIANLEVASYKRFPNISEILICLHILKNNVRFKLDEKDEELDTAFDSFEQLLDSTDEVYASLKSFHEVNVL
jgi:hypothetical protein